MKTKDMLQSILLKLESIERNMVDTGTAKTIEDDINLCNDDIKQKLVEITKNQQLISEREATEIELNRINSIRMLPVYRRDSYFNNNATIDSDKNTPLTPDELKQINEFWEPYRFALKNNPETQRVFSRISGRFDPSYVGFGFMRYEMRRFYYHPTYVLGCHKNFLRRIFPFAKQPVTVAYNSFGQFFVDDVSPITIDDAVNICYEVVHNNCNKELIVKPAYDSGMGNNISFIDDSFSKEDIKKILIDAGENSICQEVLRNHQSISKLYSKSLNTLRIATMIWKNKVYHVGTILRMGIDKRVDNVSAGGLCCRVYDDGILGDFAIDNFGKRYYFHPTSNIVFKDYQIDNYKKALDLALTLHSSFRQQKYISWDITIDEQGDAVLIEMNTPGSSEVLQCVGINVFINKEIAKEILDEYLIKRFYFEKANKEYDYRLFSDHVSLTKYYGNEPLVTAPKTIDSKPVKMIYKDTYTNINIKQIIVGKDVYLEQTDFSSCAPSCEIIRV